MCLDIATLLFNTPILPIMNFKIPEEALILTLLSENSRHSSLELTKSYPKAKKKPSTHQEIVEHFSRVNSN